MAGQIGTADDDKAYTLRYPHRNKKGFALGRSLFYGFDDQLN